jgi:hypothetical protein
MSNTGKNIVLLILLFIISMSIGVNLSIFKMSLPEVDVVQAAGNVVAKKTSEISTVEYKVIYLKQGKLYLQRVKTGEVIGMDNQDLIKKALKGTIKRGDIIRL